LPASASISCGAKSGEVGYAAKGIRAGMKMIAKLFLATPDSPLSSTHSTYLGPYYSATSTQALSARMAALANAVADAEEDNADARHVVENFEEWADSIYETEKELLLEAVARRSQFTFDIIHWISHVTSVLLALSNTKACDEHTQEELRRHATWLISVLSFVPGDEDTVRFIENFQLTETLFDSAVDARTRGCIEVAEKIAGLLLSWTFKGGRFQTGWAILERAIYGVATLALADGDAAVAKLTADIAARIAAGGLPDQELRDRSAREIRGRAKTLYRQGHWGSSIECAMAQLDRQQLQPVLEQIADLISPETAGQAAKHGIF
jgi:hypothetical protein